MFDTQDRYKVKNDSLKHGDYIEVNIGNDKDPKLIKIEKGANEKEKKGIINLVRYIEMYLHLHMMSLKHIGRTFSNTLYP